MSTTLNELVRDQILAEGPQIEHPDAREVYVDIELTNMTNVELLERISNALRKASTNSAVRPWL